MLNLFISQVKIWWKPYDKKIIITLKIISPTTD